MYLVNDLDLSQNVTSVFVRIPYQVQVLEISIRIICFKVEVNSYCGVVYLYYILPIFSFIFFIF